MRTIQQPPLLTGSQDIPNVTDTASLSASCDSSKMLLGEGDKLGSLGPDIISHTNPLSTMGKHRRKIIAIRDVDTSSGIVLSQIVKFYLIPVFRFGKFGSDTKNM